MQILFWFDLYFSILKYHYSGLKILHFENALFFLYSLNEINTFNGSIPILIEYSFEY